MPESTPLKRFYSSVEAAAFLCTTPATLDQLCFKRLIRYSQPTGRKRLFDIADLEAFAALNVREPVGNEEVARRATEYLDRSPLSQDTAESVLSGIAPTGRKRRGKRTAFAK